MRSFRRGTQWNSVAFHGLVGVRRYALFLQSPSEFASGDLGGLPAEVRDGHAAIPDDLSGGMSRSAGI